MAENLNLTARQRVDYYKEALQSFRSRFEGPFICNILKSLCREDYDGYRVFGDSTLFVQNNFPEFYEQLEKLSPGHFCFTDTKAGDMLRIRALSAAIEAANRNALIEDELAAAGAGNIL